MYPLAFATASTFTTGFFPVLRSQSDSALWLMKNGSHEIKKQNVKNTQKAVVNQHVKNKMKTLPLRIYRKAILLGVMMFTFGMFRFLPEPNQNVFSEKHFGHPNMCVWQEKDK